MEREIDEEYDVLIAGGSLVGMTTAMLLGHHGARCLVVERHGGSAIHPRAALMLQRSMEILRGAGIEDEVVTRSAEQFEADGAIMTVASLAGEEIAWNIPRINLGVEDLSPSRRLFVTQIALEPVLARRARENGATVRFGTELTTFAQDADGVTATVRDRGDGSERTVRARYLIGADGPRSPVREGLGIATSGRGVFSRAITIYFRADVADLLRERNLSVIMVINPEVRGFFRLEKPYHSGFLVVHTLGDPDHPNTDVWTGLTDERCLAYVRAALGVQDIDVDVEDVMRWEARADVAERYGEGRILLAGDAAHVMPPYGGFGGNTGIHDAHNLAWKIGAVVRGAAGPGLVRTYDTERRPVGAFTVEQAYARYVTRAARDLIPLGHAEMVGDDHVDLGQRYASTAVVGENGAAPAPAGDPRTWEGMPGTRAPHLELLRDGAPISSIDLYDRQLVLLTGSDGAAWADAGRSMAGDLDVHVVGSGPVQDPGGAFPGAHGIGPSGAVLVRPDGIVAWRARDDAEAGPAALRGVVDTVLHRS